MKIADHIENTEPVFEGADMYRAVKADGAFTAVHVFPFQLMEEHLVFFNKQVEQLGEAYIEYRTAIPRVLSYGFTQTGSFPFIETEWIDGYSLDQIIKKRKALSIPEIINIAEEVSRTMAQCHKLGVVHGNINTTNIVWDETAGRYNITGFRFGLESPRIPNLSSRSVAIIVPEQKHKLKSKQDDVHDIGRVLWQLLTGKNNWHPGDDLNELHFRHLPADDNPEINERTVPAWFITCINKTLGISKDKNFEDAVQLYSFILSHHKTPFQKKDWYRSKPQSFKVEPKASPGKAGPFFKLIKSKWPQALKRKVNKLHFVFDRNIATGLIIAALLLGFSIYAQKRENQHKDEVTQLQTPPIVNTKDSVTNNIQKKEVPVEKSSSDTSQQKPRNNTASVEKKPVVVPTADSVTLGQTDETSNELGSYKVRSKAYFHNEPDETTRRNAFIVHWNNAVLHPLKEQGDFVYVVFTNHLGQISKGWLKKQDLIKQ